MSYLSTNTSKPVLVMCPYVPHCSSPESCCFIAKCIEASKWARFSVCTGEKISTSGGSKRTRKKKRFCLSNIETIHTTLHSGPAKAKTCYMPTERKRNETRPVHAVLAPLARHMCQDFVVLPFLAFKADYR